MHQRPIWHAVRDWCARIAWLRMRPGCVQESANVGAEILVQHNAVSDQFELQTTCCAIGNHRHVPSAADGQPAYTSASLAQAQRAPTLLYLLCVLPFGVIRLVPSVCAACILLRANQCGASDDWSSTRWLQRPQRDWLTACLPVGHVARAHGAMCADPIPQDDAATVYGEAEQPPCAPPA